MKNEWPQSRFDTSEVIPFSFILDGKSSQEFLSEWKTEYKSGKIDKNRKSYTAIYTDRKTGLSVRYEAVKYLDFPSVEWTLHFKNTGDSDSPIIEEIKALDINYELDDNGFYALRRIRGDVCGPESFEPLVEKLAPHETRILASAGGRPTNYTAPYFNLEWQDQGLIIAIGWPGQWSAEFTRADLRKLRITAGQEKARFYLKPGEEVRTPLIVLQFRENQDWLTAQNIWRRWMMAYNMPKVDGGLPKPLLFGGASRMYEEMVRATEENQKMCIDRYIEEKIPIDYWWMDAGWYKIFDKWSDVGTWEVDEKRFPNGISAISDYAHSKGLKTLLWFEPERVKPGTWLANEHPEWLFNYDGRRLLFNQGNPEAYKWLVERIDSLIVSEKIDLYRQDFNMNPLDSLRHFDEPDREGINEIKWVEGFLAFWDELRRRHPDMLIDNCASGGRRLDIETLRRSIPLWRSDYRFETIAHQGMTYGLSMWIPYHGTGTSGNDDTTAYFEGPEPIKPYVVISDFAPGFSLGPDIRVRESDYALWRKLMGMWRILSKSYYGDFYPLTPYSLENDVWVAWQFAREDAGAVQVFRRKDAQDSSKIFKLHGLEEAAEYELTDLATGEKRTVKGGEIEVNIPEAPGAVVLTYRKT